MIRKFIWNTIFGIGCLFCMIGGCALDSESLTIPMIFICVGLMIGFVGYRGITKTAAVMEEEK